jgi:hypothetical protein
LSSSHMKAQFCGAAAQRFIRYAAAASLPLVAG